MEKTKNLQEKIYEAKLAIVSAINNEAIEKGTLSPEGAVALSEALKFLFEVQPSNQVF